VAELPALVRIYGRLVAARVRSDWQYRTSFVFFFFGAFFATFLDFLGIAVLFHASRSWKDGTWPRSPTCTERPASASPSATSS
jgi:ABC-type uncharacterized transport system permease subunit